MKKRLISLFLCVAMLFGLLPSVVVFAEDVPAISIYHSGKAVSKMELSEFESETVFANLAQSASGCFQWQIQVSKDTWANISGATGASLTMRYAMLANLLDDNGQVQIRCRFTPNQGEVIVSDPVKVQMVSDYSVTTLEEWVAPDPVAIILDPGSVVVHTPEATTPTETTPAETNAPTVETTAPTAETTQPTETSQPTEPTQETTDVPAPASETAPEETTEATTAPMLANLLDMLAVKASAEETENETYDIVVKYLFENGETVSGSYTANVAKGTDFSATVTFPTIAGYLPYLGENGESTTKLEIDIKSISGPVEYTVWYKPTNVKYTVIHKLQNVDNDEYTVVKTDTDKFGLTGSQVPEVAEKYEGFYALIYERPNIAADGSTEIEVKYDRYYYLMNFDMDGGYGTEPVYARYGASLGTVTEPTKPGYTFNGWTLNGGSAQLPEIMPAESRTYVANWRVGDAVNYAVVYWKENADDSGYSYWGQQQMTAEAGTTVSGSDDIPESVHNDEKQYFTYNAARTDTDVVVKGDGSTVVNVYYYRNTYTIYFKGISGTCAIEEHTHGTDCNSYLDCQKTEHTHTESCTRYLSCTLGEHEHSDACYGLTCTTPEHTAHTADCLICGKAEHNHTDSCLSCVHTHTTGCYIVTNSSNQTRNLIETDEPTETLTDAGNGIYTYTITGFMGSSTTHYYVKIGDKWYCGAGRNGSDKYDTNKITFNCTHTHNESCYGCGQSQHTHSDSCYKDTLHTHTDACYGLICGQTAHTHTDACYTYTCSADDHKHTDSCYRPCTKREHTHSYQCNLSDDQNVIYVVTAKYEQNIAKVWPTADMFPNTTLNGWTIEGIDNLAVSKRVNMTSDLCDTSDGLKYATAKTGGNTQYLYYMFESFDQTSPANGNERKYYSGKFYDKSETCYQVVNSGGGDWNQKQIAGMTKVEGGVVTDDSNVFLYYTRNRNTLSFYNVNKTVKTVENIMFEQPLEDYKDSDGNLLSAFEPGYPDSLEPGAYEFVGWYTTPECYDGTEFNFTTATMPDANLTLYAKWAPVTHAVKFYLTAAHADPYTPDGAVKADFTIRHGETLNEAYVEQHLTEEAMNTAKPYGGYKFVMWYYFDDEGAKKPFDPSTQIRKDLTLYGEWSSNTLKQYTVQYVLQSDHSVKVADDLTGSGLAGTTKTFDAKGGAELYADYQEGYFPTVQSQSLLLDIDSDSLVITFEYVPMPNVPYTVKYINTETNTNVFDGVTVEDKYVENNKKAVVTETFQAISGYMPDAYQKRLVVTADGENILYFYYTKDTEHAYYKITHYTQNTDGETWAEYASSQAIGDINKRYTASPMTIPGFTYQETKYVVNGTEVTDVTTEGAALTADGLEINLYYVRNEYPYQVRYLEQGSGTPLHDPKNGTGKYGQVISESAIDIDDYDKVDPTSATLNIRIDEGEGAPNLNIITFYYKEKEVTINYVAVGPQGATNFGSVTPTVETLKVKSGTAQGSTPTPGDGFRFVGWFEDAACTQPVDTSWVTDNKIVPQKTDGKNVAAVYYAKFEYDVANLTISKTGCDAIDENQTFIFTVTGPDDYETTVVIKGNGWVTLTGLKIGRYTIHEESEWSWRYECEDRHITLVGGSFVTNFVPMENKRTETKWLDGNAYAKNIFQDDKVTRG